ncbi:MAG: hypothetical protein IKK83_05890 [Clostridia bacterium]|nr:hypothetical protein [Clostridia bacterium]
MKRFLGIILAVVMCLPLFCFDISEVGAYTSHTKIPNAVMTLKNLGTNRAVQQFYFYNDAEGNRYVFTTQRVTSNVYLSRCLVSDDGLTATCLDYVVLENYGHGEALAVYEYEGQVYVWSAGNTITDTTDDLYTTTYWARNVSRFVYTPDASAATGAKITNEKKLTNFLYASADGTSLYSGGRIFRLAFAVSPNSDRMMFWLKFKNGSTYKQYLCCYSFSQINKALSASSGSVSMATLGSHQLAKIAYDGDLPNGSMQGMGLDGTGTLYFSGGSSSQTPMVYKYSYTSSSITLKEKWTVTAKANVEIECAYMLNGAFYCIFIDDTTSSGKKNNTKIYTLDDYTVTQLHANHKYTLKELPVNTAVQNFAFSEDMSQLYVSQRSGSDTYISRLLPEGNVAVTQDYIVLAGAGIGESLEVDESISGTTYLWTGGGPVYGSDSHSTTITRLCYKVDPGAATGASYTSVTVNGMAYASADGTALDSTTVKRAAVSATSASDNRIVFRTQFTSGDIYYTVYVTSTLNQAINTAGGSSYSLKNAGSMVKSSFLLNDKPYGSFQGFDAYGVGTNSKFLYMTGGSGGDMNLPLIYKYLYTNGGNASLSAAYRIPDFMRTVQGVKVYGDTMYVAVQPRSDNMNSTVIRTLSSGYKADPVIVYPPVDYSLAHKGTAGKVENGVLRGLTAGTDLGAVLALFSNTNTLRIVNGGAVLAEGAEVGTGYVLQSLDGSGTVKDSLVLVVSGDVNCDAAVSSADYLLMAKHIKGNPILTGHPFTAGDLSYDGDLNSADYMALASIIK